jgi:hypothetical protein
MNNSHHNKNLDNKLDNQSRRDKQHQFVTSAKTELDTYQDIHDNKIMPIVINALDSMKLKNSFMSRFTKLLNTNPKYFNGKNVNEKFSLLDVIYQVLYPKGDSLKLDLLPKAIKHQLLERLLMFIARLYSTDRLISSFKLLKINQVFPEYDELVHLFGTRDIFLQHLYAPLIDKDVQDTTAHIIKRIKFVTVKLHMLRTNFSNTIEAYGLRDNHLKLDKIIVDSLNVMVAPMRDNLRDPKNNPTGDFDILIFLICLYANKAMNSIESKVNTGVFKQMNSYLSEIYFIIRLAFLNSYKFSPDTILLMNRYEFLPRYTIIHMTFKSLVDIDKWSENTCSDIIKALHSCIINVRSYYFSYCDPHIHAIIACLSEENLFKGIDDLRLPDVSLALLTKAARILEESENKEK